MVQTVDFQQTVNGEVQLYRLQCNQKEIAQFYGKLRSYVCEPKTSQQFEQLTFLRESAELLRDANQAIEQHLKIGGDALASCSKLFDKHLQDFYTFREDTLAYIREVKTHHYIS